MTMRRLFLLLCLPLLLGAKITDSTQITGIKGKMLANVQARLQELAQNRPLTSETDEELNQFIAKAMYPYGYFRPSIQIIRRGQALSVRINPGPRMLVTQLKLSVIGDGQDDAIIRQALRQFPLKQGDPLISRRYEDAKQSLMDAAEHQGYLHAGFDKAEILIDQAAYTSSITLQLNTGPRYYFGQVRFDPTYISPDVLRRYIPFEYGQPYSSEKILEFNNALSSSGYFKSVIIEPEDKNGSSVPLNVRLQQASRVNYTLGIGYGTDTGPRGRLGVQVVPVNRAGHKFNLVALGSMTENSLQGQYIIPGKNPLIDQVEILGGVSNLHYNSGNSNSVSLSVAQRHNLPHFQRVLSLNSLYERFNYSYEPRQDNFSLFPKASLTWLSKSEQLFSPNGYKVNINGLVANKALLSQTNFAQASIDARAAVTFEPIRTRLYLHGIQGATQVNNVNQLPLSLALLLGGADNMKGYSYNSIGPGKILTYGGFEVQKETRDNWYLVGFFDAGDVYMPSVKSLQRDVGVGLMWVSPVGPIKIGVAQPVNNHFQRLNNSSPRLVINMGPDL
ncbi:autotransporter assembly complex protein TamA [Legionella sp. CNM-4043-24]|uniref:autotransporter assembly complex protein TamA n=1 Tax=Legionella sp. CNM-4043-24 TaxID=3421646 RepID=UPI00403B0AB1